MPKNKIKSNHVKKTKIVPTKVNVKTKFDVKTEVIVETAAIKHPLNDKWTLWYLENDQKKSWEDQQNAVFSFDTVEDFWSIYNHILPCSEVSQGNDYSLFKNGVRPMWEDAANKNGGRWVINVAKQFRRTKLDEFWLDTLLCIIGEEFSYFQHVMGAVVNIRHSGDRISVWTKDAQNKNSVLSIGDKLKDYLRLSSDVKIAYEPHGLHKNTKPMYVL